MINICNSILILYEATLKLLVHFGPQLWNCFRKEMFGQIKIILSNKEYTLSHDRIEHRRNLKLLQQSQLTYKTKSFKGEKRSIVSKIRLDL